MNDTNKNKKNDDINNINIDNNNNTGLIHVKRNPNYNARPIRKYYKKGYCLYNEKCRYTHIKNSNSGIKDALKLNKDFSKCIATLYKLKTLIPKNNLMNVYKAIFQSKFNYCNNIWASTYSNRITKLQKLQKKAIRICLNFKQTDHIDYNKHNILDIKSLTIYQLIIYMYKHKHNLLYSTLANIFILNSDNNNCHNLRSVNNYRKEKYNTSLKKVSLSIMGPKYLNKLPNNLKSIDDINTFKIKLKLYILNNKLL